MATTSAPVTFLHEGFEAQVALRPDAVALVGSHETLRYAELDRRATHLARCLRHLGIATGDVVGLLLPRSVDAVVTILATLKLGAVYLPLDPAAPAERLAYMVEDARARLVVCHQALRGLVAPSGVATLSVDLPLPDPADVVLTPVERTHDLAYVIYTSGSTGRPKGVPIAHAGVMNLVHGQTYCPFGPAQTHLMLSSLGFDFSTLEIWGALLTGGRIVLYEETFVSLTEIGRLVREQGVTTLMMTPSLFNLLVSERLDDLRGVRQVLLGGDVPSVKTARAFLRAAPGSTLTNIYGPTENTVFTTCHTLTSPDFTDEVIPLGRTIPGTEAYVLDDDGRPVAPGEVGELWLGGVGLTRGYLNLPERTAKVFVPHPLARTGDGRLYRSGDLARELPDGSFVFLGRRDLQLKLRGHRVELGEIEAVLRDHPEVRECAVVALPGRNDGEDKRLVAYFEAAPGAEAHVDRLSAHLARRLPTYMRPAALVRVEHLPINTSGKLDRRALAERPFPESNVVREPSPRDDGELVLAMRHLWSDVLGRDVGPDDDFFDVGGTSLLAALLLARINDQFGVDLHPNVLFDGPTVRAVTARLTGEQEADTSGRVVRLREGLSGHRPLFIVGDPFLYRIVTPHLTLRGPVVALHEPLGPIEQMASAAIDDLKRVQPTGPYRLCGFSFDGLVAYEMACQLEARGERVEFLGLLDTGTPDMERMQLMTNPSFVQRALLHLRYSRHYPLPRRLKYLWDHAVVSIRVRTNRQENNPHYHTLLELVRPYRVRGCHQPVTLIRAADEDTVLIDPLMGWERHALAGITVREVPGLHLDIVRNETGARHLAAILTDCLDGPTATEVIRPPLVASHA